LVDLSPKNQDLRLGTGQAIEDAAGNPRLQLEQNNTQVLSETGNTSSPKIWLNDGNTPDFRLYTATSLDVVDYNGGFTSIKYVTSASSPGTFELTNAELEHGTEKAIVHISRTVTFGNTNWNDVFTVTGDDTAGELTVVSPDNSSNRGGFVKAYWVGNHDYLVEEKLMGNYQNFDTRWDNDTLQVRPDNTAVNTYNFKAEIYNKRSAVQWEI
jgi:hypothetical protein